MKVDVAVIGSGAAALSAAISAAASGASVAVFEKQPQFGGTTAFSGGGLWIPNNRRARAKGLIDSRDDALTYIKTLANHTGMDRVIERYLDECDPMLDFLESETSIKFESSDGHPDYQPNLPGARSAGRAINQGLFDTNRLGALKPKLRHGWASKAITVNDRAMVRPLLAFPPPERP